MDINIKLVGFFGFLAVMIIMGSSLVTISPSTSSSLINGAVILAFVFIAFTAIGKFIR